MCCYGKIINAHSDMDYFAETARPGVFNSSFNISAFKRFIFNELKEWHLVVFLSIYSYILSGGRCCSWAPDQSEFNSAVVCIPLLTLMPSLCTCMQLYLSVFSSLLLSRLPGSGVDLWPGLCPQVAGGTAFLGQKGEKGEPAVIEPVSQSFTSRSWMINLLADGDDACVKVMQMLQLCEIHQ